MWLALKADFAVLQARRDRALTYLFPCFFAVAMYRISHALGRSGFSPLARAVELFSAILTSGELDWRAEIEPGFFLEHPQGVGIGDGVVIGRNVVIGIGVLLGAAESPSGVSGFPTIGDNVQIWAKASVLGPVHVGEGAVIGAHALVVNDVPAGAVARGVPAKSYLNGQLVQPGGGEG
jgi:serine O-acetyltransferase